MSRGSLDGPPAVTPSLSGSRCRSSVTSRPLGDGGVCPGPVRIIHTWLPRPFTHTNTHFRPYMVILVYVHEQSRDNRHTLTHSYTLLFTYCHTRGHHTLPYADSLTHTHSLPYVHTLHRRTQTGPLSGCTRDSVLVIVVSVIRHYFLPTYPHPSRDTPWESTSTRGPFLGEGSTPVSDSLLDLRSDPDDTSESRPSLIGIPCPRLRPPTSFDYRSESIPDVVTAP